MVLNKALHQLIEQGCFMVLASGDPQPTVEKELPGPIRVQQAHQLVAAPPDAARPLLGRHLLGVHRMVVFIKQQS